MTEPPRRPRPLDDDLPDELRTLIHKVGAPTPLDRDTRARLRRRLAEATLPDLPPKKPHVWRHHAPKAALAVLAPLFLFLLWLTRQSVDPPVALPAPDRATAPQRGHSLDTSSDADLSNDAANRRPPAPRRDGPGARWHSVRNRCSDAVCRREPACCTDAWHARCDDLLLEAARLNNSFSGGIGRCYYHDREQCPGCACEYYLKVGNPKTDAIGYDQGTGCLRDREALLSTLKSQCAEAVCE